MRETIRSWGEPEPARDLPFVDATVALFALLVAFSLRAVTNADFANSWSGVGPHIRVAAPVLVVALLLAGTAVGSYGTPRPSVRTHAVAAGYATAIAAVWAAHWGGEPSSMFVLVTLFGALVGLLYLGRRTYATLAAA